MHLECFKTVINNRPFIYSGAHTAGYMMKKARDLVHIICVRAFPMGHAVRVWPCWFRFWM